MSHPGAHAGGHAKTFPCSGTAMIIGLMNGQRDNVSQSLRRRTLACMIAAAGLVYLPSCGDDGSSGMTPDGGDGGDGGPGVAPDAMVTDFEPPVVQVVFPPPYSVTDADTITIRGTAGDASGVGAISVNGTPATSDNGFLDWQAQVDLTEGENQVVFTLEDVYGNDAEMTSEVIVVRTAELRPVASATTWDRMNDRVVVLDAPGKKIYTVDPQTRRRTLLSDGTTGAQPLENPTGLGWDVQSNRVLVTDQDAGTLLAVDIATGERTLLSGAGQGTGADFERPTAVTWDEAGNRALVVDGAASDQRLVSVDASGNRSQVANLGSIIETAVSITWDQQGERALVLDGFVGRALYAVEGGTIAPISTSDDGQPNPFSTPVAVAWDPVGNRAIVADRGLNALLAVDLQTGARTIVAAPGIGNGPAPRSVAGLAWDHAGNRALVADSDLGAVVAVEVDTGDGQVLSDAYHGAGPTLRSATALGWDTEADRALILDATIGGVMSLDPKTGDRAMITAPFLGSGQTLSTPVDITWDEAFNRVLILDADDGSLIAADALTGQRIVLSNGADGLQPDLRAARSLAWDSYNNRALIANEQEIVAIEVADGERSIASRLNILGAGPAFSIPRAIAVWQSEPGNDVVFVADSGLGALLYVDVDFESTTSGDRAVLSDESTGTGPALLQPVGVVWDNDRNLALVIDNGLGALVGVDPDTGNRTILADKETGNGPTFGVLGGVEWDPVSSRVLVLDTSLQAVLAVDPATGDRVILSR